MLLLRCRFIMLTMKMPLIRLISRLVLGSVILMICLSIPDAHGSVKSQIQSIAIKDDDGQATIDIAFSGVPVFTAVSVEGHVQVDLPDSIWAAGVAQSGQGAGSVISYRRQASAQGSRIVFKTSTRLRIASSELLPGTGQSPTLEITLRSETEEAPVYVPDIGPVVTQSSGILYAPIIQAAPATQAVTPVAPPSVQCNSSTSMTGTFDGAPVYSFSKCK